MCELAQLVDRLRDFLDRAVERLDTGLHRSDAKLVLCVAKREPDRDEALLGTIMEVAFDASSLRVASLDDPYSRGLDLGELAAQLTCSRAISIARPPFSIS